MASNCGVVCLHFCFTVNHEEVNFPLVENLLRQYLNRFIESRQKCGAVIPTFFMCGKLFEIAYSGLQSNSWQSDENNVSAIVSDSFIPFEQGQKRRQMFRHSIVYTNKCNFIPCILEQTDRKQ